MMKRRLFLLLTLFMIGVILPQNVFAESKETAVSIQFAEGKADAIPTSPVPKDQLPKSGGTHPSYVEVSTRKLLPKTGEILSFSGRLIGFYLLGLFLLLILVRRKAEEEAYE